MKSRNYEEMVRRIADSARVNLNYGEEYIINVSYYDNGEMTVTIYDGSESPHFRAFDLDPLGNLVQEWYKENEDDDWLFSEVE